MRRRLPAFAALLATVAPLLASVPAAPAQSGGQPPVTRLSRPQVVIEALGEGVVRVPPDEAVLTLGVTTEGPTAHEAIEENARRMSAVVQALAAAGFSGPGVSSHTLRLDPVIEHRRDQVPRIAGFRAANQVEVRTPGPETIGQALDAAVGAGANVAAGLAFTLRDPGAARLSALRLATDDARSRAAAIAGALGKQVVRVLEVRVLDGAPPPVPLAGVSALAAGAPPTPVEPGDITVRARVLLRAEAQ